LNGAARISAIASIRQSCRIVSGIRPGLWARLLGHSAADVDEIVGDHATTFAKMGRGQRSLRLQRLKYAPKFFDLLRIVCDLSNDRKPIDIHGIAATMARATTSAPM
jgi:hypothetical protein